jgi:hypothetical protein
MSEGLGVSIRRNVVSAMAVALVMSGVLSGCSDDSDDDPPSSGLPSESELTESAPTSPSPSPTEPTGPQPPPLPDAAKAPGKAGAKAFVAYYIRLLNYAQHTGDSRGLRQHAQDCNGCETYAELAETTYRRGGWFKGGRWTPDSRTWFVARSGTGLFVAVDVRAAKGRQLQRKGSEVTRFRAARYRLNFKVTQVDRAWHVRRLETPS